MHFFEGHTVKTLNFSGFTTLLNCSMIWLKKGLYNVSSKMTLFIVYPCFIMSINVHIFRPDISAFIFTFILGTPGPR